MTVFGMDALIENANKSGSPAGSGIGIEHQFEALRRCRPSHFEKSSR